MHSIEILKINHSFLEKSANWLNDDSFNLQIGAGRFCSIEQLKWFECLDKRSDYKIFGIQVDGEWIGAVGLKNICIATKQCEYFSYIYPAEYRGLGIGYHAFKFITAYAVEELSMRCVYLLVKTFNFQAIKSYESWGFQKNETSELHDGTISMSIEIPLKIKTSD